MATVKCPLIEKGWKRGYPSHEWNDGQKDRIYWSDYEVEVIGNIHDNPELLKEAAP